MCRCFFIFYYNFARIVNVFISWPVISLYVNMNIYLNIVINYEFTNNLSCVIGTKYTLFLNTPALFLEWSPDYYVRR